MQSDQINELATALSQAQGEMQAAIKDSINPFYKSKYADLGSVWDAARPVLSKYGLCVMQTTELMGEKIVMVTLLAHKSGQWVKSMLPLNPSKNDSQGIGAAMSYFRRYSLSALVGVVCDDDDDGENDAGRTKSSTKQSIPPPEPPTPPQLPPTPPPTPQKINANQVKELIDLRSKVDAECVKNMDDYIQKTYGTKVYNYLPELAYKPLKSALDRNIKLNSEKVQS